MISLKILKLNEVELISNLKTKDYKTFLSKFFQGP